MQAMSPHRSSSLSTMYIDCTVGSARVMCIFSRSIRARTWYRALYEPHMGVCAHYVDCVMKFVA